MNSQSTIRSDRQETPVISPVRSQPKKSQVECARSGDEDNPLLIGWQFAQELKRRKVFRAAGAYVVSAWLGAQVVDMACDGFAAPPWLLQFYLVAVLFGFPVFLILSWAFEYTTSGIRLDSSIESGKAQPYKRHRIDLAIFAVLIATIILLIFLGQSSGNDVAMSVTASDEGLF